VRDPYTEKVGWQKTEVSFGIQIENENPRAVDFVLRSLVAPTFFVLNDL
jgi:hypothetical protein